MADLSPEEVQLFKDVKRTGDWDAFTERYFKLPWSGTWFTPEDRVQQYEALYTIWRNLGEPDGQFEAVIDNKPTQMKVSWDDYYGGFPTFLLPHGFRTMPWMMEFLELSTTKAIAVTGTGSGKTAGVAIRALTYCALYPGFRFLNVAPGQVQADLALGEVAKWAGNTEFAKFIKFGRGANPLWLEKPYPTITVEVVKGYPSTFICQTVKNDATAVLGGERDWINADEAQLLEGIEDAQEILATRMRGTRSTGVPRSTKLTWITNPGHNPELMSLMGQYQTLEDAGDRGIMVLEDVSTSDNIYLTRRQKDEQAKVLSGRARDRWHLGQMSAVMINAEIGSDILEICFDQKLHDWATNHGQVEDGWGITEYYKDYEPGHTYIVFADTGKSNIANMSSQNIPCIGTLDVTHFLDRPMELVSFAWFDGLGTYETFVNRFLNTMVRYQAQGYYDATNVQTAFEDLDPRFGWAPTTPIFFSGTSGVKRWAVAIFVHLASEGQFRWPRIKAFWHQANIFEYASRKKADDIIAAFLVFALALRNEGTLWTKFLDVYHWDEEEFDNEELDLPVPGQREEVYVQGSGRYDRFM
jgi:hypothetical protein